MQTVSVSDKKMRHQHHVFLLDNTGSNIFIFSRLLLLLLGLLSEKIQIFVSASLALKLRIYTQNTPIRRNPSSEFRKKNFLTVIFWIFEFWKNCAILNAFNLSQCATTDNTRMPMIRLSAKLLSLSMKMLTVSSYWSHVFLQ